LSRSRKTTSRHQSSAFENRRLANRIFSSAPARRRIQASVKYRPRTVTMPPTLHAQPAEARHRRPPSKCVSAQPPRRSFNHEWTRISTNEFERKPFSCLLVLIPHGKRDCRSYGRPPRTTRDHWRRKEP